MNKAIIIAFLSVYVSYSSHNNSSSFTEGLPRKAEAVILVIPEEKRTRDQKTFLKWVQEKYNEKSTVSKKSNVLEKVLNK